MPEQKTIQLLNLSTDELKEAILNDLRPQLESLRQELNQQGPEEYLTRNELAEKLKVSLPTINDWSKKGILKPYRLGNLVRFKKSEVEESLIEINNH